MKNLLYTFIGTAIVCVYFAIFASPAVALVAAGFGVIALVCEACYNAAVKGREASLNARARKQNQEMSQPQSLASKYGISNTQTNPGEGTDAQKNIRV